MKSYANLRAGLAICIVLILCGYQIFQSIRYYNPAILTKKFNVYGKLPPDPITEYTAKLDCLKNELSPKETIGFITNNLDEAFPTETYLLTQYGIAPVLLKNSPEAKTVIGYFPGGVEKGVLDKYSLVIVKTCKQGLFLARRK